MVAGAYDGHLIIADSVGVGGTYNDWDDVYPTQPVTTMEYRLDVLLNATGWGANNLITWMHKAADNWRITTVNLGISLKSVSGIAAGETSQDWTFGGSNWDEGSRLQLKMDWIGTTQRLWKRAHNLDTTGYSLDEDTGIWTLVDTLTAQRDIADTPQTPGPIVIKTNSNTTWGEVGGDLQLYEAMVIMDGVVTSHMIGGEVGAIPSVGLIGASVGESWNYDTGGDGVTQGAANTTGGPIPAVAGGAHTSAGLLLL